MAVAADTDNSLTWASSLSLGDLARDMEPLKCYPIPRDLQLCHDVAYPMMRMPNLLDHGKYGISSQCMQLYGMKHFHFNVETMSEVIQQSNSWLPLVKIGCHPDAKIFLCSLFAPVCLGEEHATSTIYPCRYVVCVPSTCGN